MAMAVTYTNFNGRIVSETRNGVHSDYLPDTNGNTIGLMNAAHVITDTWQYWPYGEVASRTGTNPTPLQFGGTLGYYTGILNQLYVRARYYLAQLARWLTVDPLWPESRAYDFCECNPKLLTDPSGLIPGFDAAAAALLCIASGVVGFFNGCLMTKNAPCQATCRGIGGCVVGAAIGFLTGTFPLWAKCLIGIASSLANTLLAQLCNKICGGPSVPINIPCALATTVLGLVIGCVSGPLQVARPVSVATSIINSMIGKICNTRF
jgi:RHS repeat-associated protein